MQTYEEGYVIGYNEGYSDKQCFYSDKFTVDKELLSEYELGYLDGWIQGNNDC
jgi:hypothetical protein